MQNNNKSYVVIFSKDKFEHLSIILLGWIRNLKLQIINHDFTPRLINIAKNKPFIGKYINNSVKEHKIYLGHYKGVWYEMHKESIDVTIEFYNQVIKMGNGVINYYNRILNTDKFEAYIKKEISIQVLALLKQLHTVRLSSLLLEKEILISKNPVNNFVLKYMESRYAVNYKIKWISPAWSVFSLCVYYAWLFTDILKRGVIFNRQRKNYKLAIETTWGFKDRTFRSDMIIDNNRFKTKDILMLKWHFLNDPLHETTFEEAKKRGFDTAFIPKLKINISRNFFGILFFYIYIPLKVYLELLFSSQAYLFYYMFFFHKRCFPVEVLMNLYNMKCYVSTKDWGDIEETIILNKYGAKNVLFHWSDTTNFKGSDCAFIAHNICYSWGDIHYSFYLDSYFVDRKVNIGCIYKEKYNEAVNNKEKIISGIGGFKKGKKSVVFCDTSFGNHFEYTEQFFINFLDIIRDFCKKNQDVNIILKPKNLEKELVANLTDNFEQHKKIEEELFSLNNFIYLDPLIYSIEEAIAISDICVTMATTSPSTIALICGKDGLYFDNTGNKNHPFTKKYENILVFEDKDLLFEQISNILEGKFHCRDVISEKEIREFDAFPDDRAVERLRDGIYQLML